MSNKPYILSVDDNLNNQINLTKILQNEFDLRCINKGKECLDTVSEKTPDLILLGDSMPICDDYEANKLLGSDKQYNEIPIITLSDKFFDEVQLVSNIKQRLKQ